MCTNVLVGMFTKTSVFTYYNATLKHNVLIQRIIITNYIHSKHEYLTGFYLLTVYALCHNIHCISTMYYMYIDFNKPYLHAYLH